MLRKKIFKKWLQIATKSFYKKFYCCDKNDNFIDPVLISDFDFLQNFRYKIFFDKIYFDKISVPKLSLTKIV